MELAQLDALVAAVDEGTFESAARLLGVTPSAVSQRIRALENSVGSVLLTRSKPVAATPAGLPYVRLGRQVAALTADAEAESAGAADIHPVVPIAVNGDSLATWVMPALAPLAGELRFDLYREDQDHSTELLRDGTVMAAVTTTVQPVQGCTSHRLGAMHYRPVATPAFAARWFGTGVTPAAIAAAPVVVFDRKDDIQDWFIRRHSPDAQPPRHFVPVSADFAAAVLLGFGWGMLPDEQSADALDDGRLVLLEDSSYPVELYWQQWRLRTAALDRVSAAVTAAARAALA